MFLINTRKAQSYELQGYLDWEYFTDFRLPTPPAPQVVISE